MLIPTHTLSAGPACGLRGLGCTGQCGQCPAARPAAGVRGLGAFYDTWPAPFNSPMVLIAIVVVAVILFGGGLSIFGKRKNRSGRNSRLRLARAKSELERAQILAA